jgi:hypothetical protein
LKLINLYNLLDPSALGVVHPWGLPTK